MRTTTKASHRHIFVSLFVATCCGCVSVPSSEEYDALQRAELSRIYARSDFTVRPGDNYAVTVNRVGVTVPGFSQNIAVAPDGTISLLGQDQPIAAGGLTIQELERQIAVDYRPVFGDESRLDITLRLLNSKGVVWLPDEILVLGQIRRSRTIRYRKGLTVVKALASVQGWRKQAKPSRVVLLRRNDRDETVTREIDVMAIVEHGDEEDVELFAGDIVYVPRSGVAFAGLWVHQFVRRMIFIDPGVVLRVFLLSRT